MNLKNRINQLENKLAIGSELCGCPWRTLEGFKQRADFVIANPLRKPPPDKTCSLCADIYREYNRLADERLAEAAETLAKFEM